MSNISRSEYQKVVEENKRLLKDIEILTMPEEREKRAKVFFKWQKHFNEIKLRNEFIKKAAIEYVKKHPEEFKHLPWMREFEFKK